MSNYQQTLDYLFSRLPMFSRLGSAAYKSDLDNILILSEALGNPHKSFKSVHIAGTNGKGSTSHMLAAIMQEAGYKTGLYTSPHLKDFRERIKVNGEMVDEQFVVDFTEEIRSLIEKIEPSFFEITVAMAFSWFAQQRIDIAIVEVGLGGRLDSTNIITSEVAVITNIGYDHMNLLGNSIELIAGEKAGIIKKGIPVVIGETLPETKPVFLDKASEENASITFANEVKWVSEFENEKNRLSVTVADKRTDERKTFQLSLPGLYQAKNLLTVLETVHQLQLKGWNIPAKAIEEGIANTRKLTGLHGRWEISHLDPYTVLDVAHNEDGLKEIIEQLKHCTYKNLHIIIGMVKDKEINKLLSLLPKHAKYYFTNAPIPRALAAEELAATAHQSGLQGNHFPTVMEALQDAVTHAHREDMILVCGSVFIVGEVEPGHIKW